MRLLVLLGWLLSFQALAEDVKDATIYIDIGQAKVKKSLLALPALQYSGTQGTNLSHIKIGQDLFQVINNDLTVSNLFTMIDPKAFLEDTNKVGLKPAPGEVGGFKYENWKSLQTDFLVRAAYHLSGTELTMDVYVYHVPQTKLILAKSYHIPMNFYRKMAHTFSNDLMKALTGKPGMYLTKFVATRQDTIGLKNGFKEVYTLDWDGNAPEAITSDHTIALSPAWSTKGDKIAYTSFAMHVQSKIRNSDLFLYDIAQRKRFLLSYRKGVNSGASFVPGDKEIVLTLTKDGNPDLYKMSADGVNLKALTNGPNHALNVEPAVSPDGTKIAFSSDRVGRPMIYVMNIDGTNVKRITFTGTYNSTPSWSPDGKTLAIAILDTAHFDIFTIGVDGTGLKRLTDARKPNGKGANNESPSWSPDGTHIVFVSDRTEAKQIYIVNADGTNERRITQDKANWDRPKWSPFLP